MHNECNINADELKDECRDHIFSDKHKKNGIMDLGENEDSIMDVALQIIKDIDSEKSLNEGPLRIRTFINNIKA